MDGERWKTDTKGGSMKATASFDLICKWIVDAWAGVSTDVIKKSFQACGISLSLCGGQDNEISVFKAGRQCEAGLEMLKDAAAEEKQEFEEDPYEEKHLLADSEDEDDKIVEQDFGWLTFFLTKNRYSFHDSGSY